MSQTCFLFFSSVVAPAGFEQKAHVNAPLKSMLVPKVRQIEPK
jgi:hypothetical protein